MNNPYKLHISGYSAHSHFLNNIGKDKYILDIGCNDGYIGKLSDKSNHFYGIDYSKESIVKARQIYDDAVVYDLNKLTKLPWNKKYDLILMGDVLEHVLFPEEVLKFFVTKYLKRGGKVIVSLPNVANWRVRWQLLMGKFDYTDYGILDRTHLHLYTFKSARSLVKCTDLDIDFELGSTKVFGPLIKLFPILKGIFAINIILVCKKN